MSFTKSIAASLTIAVISSSAIAGETIIYPYASHDNFCPAELQPVSISGVICCGTPNTDRSYQQVIAHQVKKARHVRKASVVDTCREGEKGCQ